MKRARRALAAAAGLALAAIAGGAGAAHLARWELGAGVFAADLPDYRGSDRSRHYFIPYPYFVYRGDRVRVDGDGIRGVLVERPDLKLNLSANAAVSVRSSDNEARAGMPDLDYVFELGPVLSWTLLRDRQAGSHWALSLPLRAVFSTDFNEITARGWVFNPQIDYVRRVAVPGGRPVRWLASFGPLFATADFHDYVYGVEPRFATPDRPAYAAPGGYSGSRLLLSVGRNMSDSLLFGAFFRYDSLEGAAFDDSPLLRRNHSAMVGMALTWVFGRSAERVRHVDGEGFVPGTGGGN